MRFPRSLKTVGILLLLAWLGAVGWSRYYWGYFLARPEVPAPVLEARTVRSASYVETHVEPDGSRRLVADPQLSLSSQDFDRLIGACRRDSRECHASRAVVALLDRGVLARDLPAVSEERLAPIHAQLERRGVLVEGAPGYPHAKDLNGWVLELEGAQGEPFVFLALAGLEVSNDHRPFYQLVLSERGVESGQHYYFDVAGIEGLEWPQMFIVLAATLPVFSYVAYLLGLAMIALWRSLPFNRAAHGS